MAIYWTDNERDINKSFFHPNEIMGEVQRQIYHNLHCEGHYRGFVRASVLTLRCEECSYETVKIGEVIVRSITFAPIDNNHVANR